MFTFKNVLIKKSILIYFILIILIYLYNKEIFIENDLSKIAWLIIILSFISYIITKKYFI